MVNFERWQIANSTFVSPVTQWPLPGDLFVKSFQAGSGVDSAIPSVIQRLPLADMFINLFLKTRRLLQFTLQFIHGTIYQFENQCHVLVSF